MGSRYYYVDAADQPKKFLPIAGGSLRSEFYQSILATRIRTEFIVKLTCPPLMSLF